MFARAEEILSLFDFDLSGKRVAEFGSGSGELIWKLSKIVGEDGHVYAIDVQKGLLDRIDSNLSERDVTNVTTIWSDLEILGSTKIPESSLDASVISDVLFQIEDKSSFMDEVLRLMKQESQVLVVDWEDSFSGLGPNDKRVFSRDEALDLLISKNFEIVKKVPLSSHHYGILANRT